MNKREKTFIKEIKELYEKDGYKLENNEAKRLLELYFKKSTKPNMLIKVLDEYGDFNLIKDTLEYFEDNNPECSQYKVIFLKGYDKLEANKFSDFNMVIEDDTIINKMKISLIKYGEISELFNYNIKAIDEAKRYLNEFKKVSINNATGLGKTLIVKEIMKTKEFNSILYLAPSDEILRQSMNSFGDRFNVEYKTFAKMHYNREMCFNQYNLIIIDEYHRVGAPKWEDTIKTLLENNKESYLIGLTATYVRYLDNARDMRAELFQDKFVSEITVNEALARRILTTPTYVYSVYSINYEKRNLIERIKNSKMGEAEKHKTLNEVNTRCLAWEKDENIVNLIREHSSGNKNKFIIFCKNISHMYDVEGLVVKWFERSFNKKVKTLKIFTGVEKRKFILDRFNNNPEDEITLLFAVDILNEGVHLGGKVSGIIFLRETESPIVYFQQLGRALQSNNTENVVIFDFVRNFSNIKSKARLNIKDQDTEAINKKRRNLNLKPINFKFNIINNSEEIVEFFNSVYERVSSSFETKYEELKNFYKINGSAAVPVKSSPLGEWCSKMRTKKRKGTLTIEQIKKLDELNFTWDIYEDMWMSKYNQYKLYKEESKTLTTELKNWENNQKKAHKSGILSEKKIERLKEINFDFKRKDKKNNLSWDGMYDLVVEYNKENKEMPKYNTEYKGYKIGVWVFNQRYVLEKSKDEDRVTKFKNLSLFSKTKQRKSFEDRLDELKKVKEGKIEKTKDIIDYMSKNRVLYRKGKLPKKKYEALKEYMDFKEKEFAK